MTAFSGQKITTLLLVTLAAIACSEVFYVSQQRSSVEHLVRTHAKAWETGDEVLLSSVLADDAVFAYPGRRLSKTQALEDIRYFKENYRDTKVHINSIVIDGDSVAVEWQFATTKIETGKREVVSDAVIAKIRDGKFISWKEYLDGRVKGLQADGQLELEEGKEPFPWPAKTSLYKPAK